MMYFLVYSRGQHDDFEFQTFSDAIQLTEFVDTLASRCSDFKIHHVFRGQPVKLTPVQVATKYKLETA